MNNIFTNMLYVLFPVLLYFLVGAYNKGIDNDNHYLLSISLVLSVLLVFCFSFDVNGYDSLYLVNIPLLIGYLEKKNICILLSIIIVIGYIYYGFNIYYVITNYLVLYFLYLVFYRYFKYIFILITCIFIIIYHDFNIDYLFNIIIYLLTNYFVLYLFYYICRVMKFYMTLREIQTNKELQQSLFKISHEIKNPIAVCRGYLELMDGSKSKYDEYIPIIKNEINHSLQILKDFSVIGKLRVNLDVMDINVLLDEVINDYKLILFSKKINIEFVNDDELLVNGDYIRLKEVFINIIKNSIEALDGVDNPYIRISSYKKNNNIIIKVEDNGCGSDSVDKISEPFFTTKENGTGLGTYLSREIINLHKGSVKYKSNGRGMEVTIKLDSYAIKKKL